MAYFGNEPADVALKVGSGVITATEIQDASIITADIANDAITANQIDEDGTGFQMGSLGVGASPSFKFDVQDNSTTWASRVLNANAGGQALLVRTDATNDATALGVYANGAYRLLVTETASTFSNKVTIASTGVNAAPSLAIDNSSSSSYIHSIEALGANMTQGQNNIINLGKIGSTKNSAVIGYKWDSAGSDDNLLTFEHWGTGPLITMDGVGTTTFSGLTHLKGSAWNSILRLGDTSRSGEQLTHMNNGSVNFSIYTSNGTKGVLTANHDGSAMTLGADYTSGTLTVYAPTTFASSVAINNASIGSHKLVVDNGTTSLNRGNTSGDILDVRGLNASQFSVTTTATTVGKRFYVTANLDGNFGTELYNAHATGHGLKVRGGSTSSHYSLYVSNNDQTAMNFQVLGDGQCQTGSIMKSPLFRTNTQATSVANGTWTNLNGLTSLGAGLYIIHAYKDNYAGNDWSARGIVEATGHTTIDGDFENQSGFQLRVDGQNVQLYHTLGNTFGITVAWLKIG